MLELTFSFDAPLEVNPVPSEDTQAQLNEFRRMPWIKPNYKAATLQRPASQSGPKLVTHHVRRSESLASG
jgi:hypothetical protein